MRALMDGDFLLTNETARRLYHAAAEGLPVLELRSPVTARFIARNLPFDSLTHLLLGHNPEAWRLMRAWGVEESVIRGEEEDREKFRLFAMALSQAPGHPLYAETHLALQRIFGIDMPLTGETAGEIYDYAGNLLQSDACRPQALMDRFRVSVVCTGDDPADDLTFHRVIAGEAGLKGRVLPGFRPDGLLGVEQPGFADAVARLSRAANMEIRSTADVLTALERRADYFHAFGSRTAIHTLASVPWGECSFKQADKAFQAAMAGDAMKHKHAESYRTVLLVGLGALYAQRGWAQQYFLGEISNVHTAMLQRFGPDGGFDAIGDEPLARNLSRLLNAQEAQGLLPRTVLYSPRPGDAAVMAGLLGSFQQGGIRGKMQLGLTDNSCLRPRIEAVAQLGVLGAWTGSCVGGSFPVPVRQEYFRRVICDLLGRWAEQGEYHAGEAQLQALVRSICYENAKFYFGF